jgi:hypothetical protein
MDPAARALHFVPVVLDGHCPCPGQVSDLMRVLHPQAAGVVDVSAARADALREHVPGLVRVLVPGQERTRRTGLLARLPLHPALAGPALWQLLPRQVIGARGIGKFPLLREISRSSRAMRSSSSAIFASLSYTSIRSRPAGSRSRAFAARSSAASPGTPAVSGASGTPVLHQNRPCMSNAAHLTGQGSGKAG